MFHVGEPIALLTLRAGPHQRSHHRRTARMALTASGGERGNSHHQLHLRRAVQGDRQDRMTMGCRPARRARRKVYFHEEPPQAQFRRSARLFATGQEVALDSISMSFSLSGRITEIVGVRMISQQKSARRFALQRKQDSSAQGSRHRRHVAGRLLAGSRRLCSSQPKRIMPLRALRHNYEGASIFPIQVVISS